METARAVLTARGKIRLVKWVKTRETAEWADGLAEEIKPRVDEVLQGAGFEAIGRKLEAGIA